MASQPATRTDTNREQLVLLCEVRQGVRPWTMARLEDLSSEGFKIAWLPDCDAAKPVKIRIPGLQMLTAEVRWQQGKAVGCAFSEPLHVAVFEGIVRKVRTDFA
jgi:PilZ domain